MASQDRKLILKNILVFGGILGAVNIILSIVLQQLHAGKSQGELTMLIETEFWLWELVRIGVLVWSLFYITKKLEEFNYWKLVVNSIGIVFLTYHLFYLFDVIDYYVIHEPPVKTDTSALDKLLTLMEYNPPPRYLPYQLFISPLIDDIPFLIRAGEYSQVLSMLIFGVVTQPLWISTLMFFIFRKRERNKKIESENSLIDK